MQKKILLNILLCSALFASRADNLALTMQQLNQSQIRTDNNLWQRMSDGFALDHSETKEVKYWEKRYGSPKYFNIIMQNAAPYLYFVVTEMERRGIPTELALIPIVESTYNPNAVSPAAISTGMWQFVSSSGKRFGMIQNSDLDERKDIVKSTRAAITYLQYLHDMFGSWELAIAAYNWGEGNINTAVNNSSSRNFYDLDVRDVTHQYVPKVIALANIIQNPRKFGIKLTNLPNQPYFAIINPQAPLKVTDFMTMSNLSPALNKKLNPQYNSTSYSVSPAQRLLLPVSNQPTYLAALGSNPNYIPAPISAPTDPVIAASNNTPNNNNSNSATSNDSSSDGIVALAAASSTSNNQTANTATAPNPTSSDPIGDEAAIKLSDNQNPAPRAADNTGNKQNMVNDLLDGTNTTATAKSANNNNTSSKDGFTNYVVVSGDTLYSIAKRFAVPAEKIKADNQMVDNNVKLNQVLLIRTGSSNS
ncbi:MAG: LysM peptidoglycan-binding domain-containing protein [Neisseriaceae bacterium]|nr:MAG: LysM peptidoglycan-binding domain-containing protein [Neisseriaceae bacterium]